MCMNSCVFFISSASSRCLDHVVRSTSKTNLQKGTAPDWSPRDAMQTNTDSRNGAESETTHLEVRPYEVSGRIG